MKLSWFFRNWYCHRGKFHREAMKRIALEGVKGCESARRRETWIKGDDEKRIFLGKELLIHHASGRKNVGGGGGAGGGGGLVESRGKKKKNPKGVPDSFAHIENSRGGRGARGTLGSRLGSRGEINRKRENLVR